jgi:hypothetical protein
MSAYLQSALRYRLAVPAWLLAVAIAGAIAIGAVVLIGGSDQSAVPAAGAQAAPARATLAHQHPVCVDSRVVGHC